jgi:hypothetical protein
VTKELELTPAPAKRNRHVVIAVNHLHTRLIILTDRRVSLSKEIEEIETAIAALE